MTELPDPTYDELDLQLEESRRELAQLQAELDASHHLNTATVQPRAGQDPPAVRWIPDGEHAGIYLYVPEFSRWRRTWSDTHGIKDCTVQQIPAGSEPLFSTHDVELAIDAYREQREQIIENARASGELDDLSEGSLHQDALTGALLELSDVAEYAICAADLRYQEEMQQ